MKISEIMNKLYTVGEKSDYTRTCDTIKSGDPDNDTGKVAVAMFATPDVVKCASAWGAGLLIVHEPTYYNHWDNRSDEKIESEKRKLIEDCGITIYRFHDHPHREEKDVIAQGMFGAFGLDGRVDYSDESGVIRIYLDKPVTPLQLAKQIERNCGIKHLRVCGSRDGECMVIAGMFGTPSGVFEELKSDNSQIVLTGEACEWSLCEYARDAAQLGHTKALIIMGHEGSERDGMKLTAEMLKNMIPELEVKYIESGEVYTYTDSEE
ncbi:MAG: Nif3-like dinuclear metal center hexameric protein [Clostridia bacterium]|nr:Nif3-like dinuclear metal center hexameric protein [Clostridia bacterium]